MGDGWIHLDGSAGMLVPEQVASAVSTAMRAPVSALLSRLADTLADTWTLGDEVVVSRLDEPANTDPWLRAMKRIGGNVRWSEIDIETCELPAWQYEQLVGSRTKAVSVTAASGSVGTRPDVSTIAEIAKKVGALVVVDATYAAPFVPLDIAELGVDVLVLSAQAWGGPAVGALVFRDRELLDRIPSIALDPHATGPERLELGPHAYPLLAGLVASVDYLADLDDAAAGSRRDRLLTSLGSAKSYHVGLLAQLSTELRSLPHVMLIGDAARRIPTLAFTVADRKAADVARHLASRNVCAFADDGTTGVFAALGVGEVGGAVRIGLAHYSNVFEVNQLVQVLEELV